MAKKPPESTVSPITLTRKLNHRIEKVFSYWSDTERLKKWWRPGGFKMVNAHVEARPGGEYSFELLQPDGKLIMQYGRFHEMIPPTKLVFTSKCEARDGCEQETLITVELRKDGESTEISVRHDLMTDPKCRKQAEQIWPGLLDQLEGELAQAS